VNALVDDPIANTVCGSTGVGSPTFLTPYPLAKTTESFRTMAIAIPGTFQSFIAFAA
jgi:hypothetical protein